jgi:ABC-type uncharacterized transport system substrate-binding protein
VFSGVTDPADSGLIPNQKPKNAQYASDREVTGIRYWTPPLVLIRFIRKLFPDDRNLCFLFDPTFKPDIQYKQALENTLMPDGISIRYVRFGKDGRISENDISKCRIIIGWYGLYTYQQMITDTYPNLLTVGTNISQLNQGAFAAIAPNNTEIGREAARMAAEILLKQKTASNIQIRDPSVFKIGINLKRAKELNITVPEYIQQIADHIIK